MEKREERVKVHVGAGTNCVVIGAVWFRVGGSLKTDRI